MTRDELSHDEKVAADTAAVTRYLAELTVAWWFELEHRYLCVSCFEELGGKAIMLHGARVTEDDANYLAVELGMATCDRCNRCIGHETAEAESRPERHPDEDDGRTYGDPRDAMAERLDRD